MFKKFINFFFEEDESYESQHDEEEQEVEEPVQKAVKEEPVFYEVAHKPSTFIDLENEPSEPKKRLEDKPDRKQKTGKPVPPKNPSTDYVFTSVISPIFGTSADESKTPKQAPTSSSGTTSQSAVKDSLLGTIISPIYGKVNTAVTMPVVEEVPKVEVVLPPMFDLDDLIGKHQKRLEGAEDDLHQFSLFEAEEQPAQDVEAEMEEFGIREYFDAKRK